MEVRIDPGGAFGTTVEAGAVEVRVVIVDEESTMKMKDEDEGCVHREARNGAKQKPDEDVRGR